MPPHMPFPPCSDPHTMDFRVEVFDELPSTNTWLYKYALQKPEGYCVQALRQISGKGRFGNSWTSPPGNLYLSVLLKPDCDLGRGGQITFCIAVSLTETVLKFVPDKNLLKLKWPNDVLLNDKKIAGILLESASGNNGRVDFIVAGIGLNIYGQSESYAKLSDIEGFNADIDDIRDEFLNTLKENYETWSTKGFENIRQRWLLYAKGIGETIIVRLRESRFEGTFRALDKDGCLLLEREDKKTNKMITQRISAGEISFGQQNKSE